MTVDKRRHNERSKSYAGHKVRRSTQRCRPGSWPGRWWDQCLLAERWRWSVLSCCLGSRSARQRQIKVSVIFGVFRYLRRCCMQGWLWHQPRDHKDISEPHLSRIRATVLFIFLQKLQSHFQTGGIHLRVPWPENSNTCPKSEPFSLPPNTLQPHVMFFARHLQL